MVPHRAPDGLRARRAEANQGQAVTVSQRGAFLVVCKMQFICDLEVVQKLLSRSRRLRAQSCLACRLRTLLGLLFSLGLAAPVRLSLRGVGALRGMSRAAVALVVGAEAGI